MLAKGSSTTFIRSSIIKSSGFVKIGNVWQTMSKDDVSVFAKQLLVFSIAVDYSGRWWVYHATDIVDEFEDEASLSAAR